MKCYQIKNWDKHYENAKSRTIDKKSWASIPNKQDGLGYSRLLLQENGEALYGAFVAVILCVSKQQRIREGYLTDTGRIDGVPYDATALALKTRFSSKTIQEMLLICSSPTIDWIKEIESKDTTRIPEGYHEDTSISLKKDGGKEGIEGGRTPTRTEVSTYAKSFECPMPNEFANEFFDSMEANGWMWGSNPVVDWKAAFRTRATSWRSKNGNLVQKPKQKVHKV